MAFSYNIIHTCVGLLSVVTSTTYMLQLDNKPNQLVKKLGHCSCTRAHRYVDPKLVKERKINVKSTKFKETVSSAITDSLLDVS